MITRKLILLPLLAAGLLLTACGHDKPLEPGRVTGKDFTAAHDEHYTTWLCFSYDKNGQCTLNMPIDNVDYVADQWTLHVRRDSNGKNEDVNVSQADYDHYSVEDRWEPTPR